MNYNLIYRLDTIKMAQIWFDLFDLDLSPLTLIFCMDVTFGQGNMSWKFYTDTWREHVEKGVTDGQTDGRTEAFIKLLGRS